MLGHMVRVCLVLEKTTNQSSKVALLFCIPTSKKITVPLALQLHQCSVLSVFWILAILIGM